MGFHQVVNAQQNVVSTGGDVSGSDGSVSYSVGQIAFQHVSSTSGQINEGVQQPYELFVVSLNDREISSFNVSVYPNPAAQQLFIEFKEEVSEKFSYKLFDLSGRLVNEGQLQTFKTRLTVEDLPPATYLLHIYSNQNHFEAFKIIKR